MLLLLGCHAGDAAGGATIVRDSAGVSIATIGVRPDDVPEWELGARPELVISGAGSAASPYFAHVVGAAWLHDGRVLVLDDQAHQVQVFDSAGLYLRSLGREGDGPGEFQSLSAVSVTRDDSIFVYDRALDRLSVFDPDEGFVRSVSFNVGDDARPPLDVWAVGSDRLVAYGVRPRLDELSGPYPRRADWDALLTLYDGQGGRVSGPLEFPGPYSADVEGGDVALPFANYPVVAARDGRIVFGSGQAYHLTVFDSELRTTAEIHWPGGSEPVTSEEVPAVRDAIRSQYRPLSIEIATMLEKAMLSPDLLPERRPALGGVIIDPAGRIWVSRFEPSLLGPNDEWHVLAGDGRPIGRLRLRPGSELVAIQGDRVMLVTRDALDVQHVAIYRIVSP